jgi:hypothetical protein
MGSLKLFIPSLADVLGVNRHALYERQRVLMRENLLTAIPGRGPGSGVRISPASVGMLLISFLATDGLADAGPDTKALAQAKYVERPADELRSAKTFRAAITNMLAFEDVAAAVARIKVERRYLQATIFLREPQSTEPLHWADFGASQFDLPHDRFETVSWLPGDCVREANRMIREAAEQQG